MSDPRAERTRAALRAALLAECERQPLEKVSVSALVRRAGVGRATFYLHYDDLRALAVDTCGEVVRDAVDALHAWRGVPDPAVPPAALVDFLHAVDARAALYRSLLTPGGGGPLGELMHQQLAERSRHERDLRGAPHAAVVATAVAATFTALLADWLHDRLPGSAEDLAGHAWRLLIALHKGL